MATEPSVSFTVTPQVISPGQPTTLRWDVEGALEVYLDGQGVTVHSEDDREWLPHEKPEGWHSRA